MLCPQRESHDRWDGGHRTISLPGPASQAQLTPHCTCSSRGPSCVTAKPQVSLGVRITPASAAQTSALRGAGRKCLWGEGGQWSQNKAQQVELAWGTSLWPSAVTPRRRCNLMSGGHHAVNNKGTRVWAEGGLVTFSAAGATTRATIKRKRPSPGPGSPTV